MTTVETKDRIAFENLFASTGFHWTSANKSRRCSISEVTSRFLKKKLTAS